MSSLAMATSSTYHPSIGSHLLLWLFFILMSISPAAAGSARHHNPGHYLRLFDIPELCPHLSFVMPWTVATTAAAGDDWQGNRVGEEVLLLAYGPLTIRHTFICNFVMLSFRDITKVII